MSIRRHLERWRNFILPLCVAIYGATGFYCVQSDESAVAYLLGRAIGRDVLPGIHWNPPRPWGRVTVARTTTNFTMPLGYRMLERAGQPAISDLWLTGDTNIVTARLDIQYSIRSLTAFKLAHATPTELLRQAGERALTLFLVGEEVDAVLTTRRHELQAAVHRGVQEQLDREGVGIDIQTVTVRELAPPERGSVRSAFQEIQSARADLERRVHEAHAYHATLLAEAGGEAGRLLSAAKADRHRRIALAQGEADRFLALAGEHRRAPVVTEQRLYLETLERLLPKMQTYVVDSKSEGKVNLRLVD